MLILRSVAFALTIGAVCVGSLSPSCLAETVQLRKQMTVDEQQCFRELFRQSTYRDLSDRYIETSLSETIAARLDLKGSGRLGYVFIIRDNEYCGSAGCSMFIGERRKNKSCRLLADGKGATEKNITVLRRRDHRYRRLYTPCELRFGGRKYAQVREECPTAVIQQ